MTTGGADGLLPGMSESQPRALQTRYSFKPKHDYVCIRVDPVARQIGHIHIPDTALESFATKEQNQGTVIAVGPGKPHPVSGELVKPGVEIGEEVLFHMGSVVEIGLGQPPPAEDDPDGDDEPELEDTPTYLVVRSEGILGEVVDNYPGYDPIAALTSREDEDEDEEAA